MMKEFIISSAVNYLGTIVGGRRHADCYRTIRELLNVNVVRTDRKDQGFLTSTGRFVDRELGWKIAKRNNQFVHKIFDGDAEGILTSEDLFED